VLYVGQSRVLRSRLLSYFRATGRRNKAARILRHAFQIELEGAIGVCRDRAPQMAKAASEESGWAIRRVSLRNRNPKAVPDGWERAALEDFDRRMAAGENPATLEKGEIVEQDGRKFYRYAKALPTQATCLACHGETAAMKPAVREKLATLYPEDKATGYREKQVRGAMSLRKPL
jgi:hypothetical protein